MLITKIVLCVSVLMLADAQAAEQQSQSAATQKVEQKADQSPQSEAGQQQPQTAANADESQPESSVPPELEEKEVDGVKLAAIEANVVSYTNQERARYGLPPLTVDKNLMETAREHASWMTRTRNMVHTSRPVAENIAMGQPHSSDVVRAWMNSSGHRANILNAGHGRIGVAAFRTEGGTIFWCQQFRR